MIKRFAVAVTLGLAALGIVTAAAAATTAGCKTTLVHLPDRLDSGHHGYWAHLDMDRTVEICVEATAGDAGAEVTSYVATITDSGTLATIPGPGLSPRQGLDLAAQTGKVVGTATQPFTAPGAAWAGYLGTPPATSTTTSTWVATVYGGPITTGGITAYSWTYTTCSERWIDASTNNDGMDVAAGDITGVACPIETTTTPVVTVSATRTAKHTTAPVTTTTAGDTATTATRSPIAIVVVGGDALPVTGASTPVPLLLYAGIGLTAADAVVLLAMLRRRRRQDQNS